MKICWDLEASVPGGSYGFKATLSAVERIKRYFICSWVNKMAMCLKFTHVWKYLTFR